MLRVHRKSLRIAGTRGIAALVLCFLSASGLASVAQPSTPGRRVAIIVALGDQIEFRRLGWTVFDTKAVGLPISDWHLDDQVTQETAELIGSRFTVTPIVYEKNTFEVQNIKWPLTPNPDVRSLIISRPADEADIYLIIRRTYYEVGSTGFEGLTVEKSKRLLVLPNSACATLEFDLVQARTAVVTASSTILPICTDFKRQDLADSLDKMTDAQLQKLREIFKVLVSKVVVRSLTAIGLIVSR